jgi:integrase
MKGVSMVVKQNKTVTKPKNKLLVEHLQMDAIIKSVRLFEKDGMIHLDYRVNPEYKKDGKSRCRFSAVEQSTRRSMQRLERDKYALALAHYLKSTTVLDEANLTVGEIALDAINEDRGNRQDDTHSDYLKIYEVSIKPIFENKILREIKVSDIKVWKNNLLKNHKFSRSRYAKYHRTLNFIFKYALENEMIDRNPASLVDKRSKLFTRSKQNQSEKYYTQSEVDKMLDGSDGWFHVLLMTYLNTGMRTGEALGLKFSDIDFDNHTIVIQRSMRKGVLKDGTKTDENRIIRMSKPLKDELLAHQKLSKSDVWVFPNPKTGKPYYEANSITRWYFKPLLKKFGIEYKTLYALRHTFASLSAQRNIPMSAIQKQLGHKKLSTTLDFYVKNNLLSDDNDMDMFDKLYA